MKIESIYPQWVQDELRKCDEKEAKILQTLTCDATTLEEFSEMRNKYLESQIHKDIQSIKFDLMEKAVPKYLITIESDKDKEHLKEIFGDKI